MSGCGLLNTSFNPLSIMSKSCSRWFKNQAWLCFYVSNKTKDFVNKSDQVFHVYASASDTHDNILRKIRENAEEAVLLCPYSMGDMDMWVLCVRLDYSEPIEIKVGCADINIGLEKIEKELKRMPLPIHPSTPAPVIKQSDNDDVPSSSSCDTAESMLP